MTPQTTTPKTNGTSTHGGPRRGAGRPRKNKGTNPVKNAQARLANGKRPDHANGRSARARLLVAAEMLLADSGYESLTVTVVCQRAGLSAQTFYNYFADKRALLAAVHGPDVEEIDRRLRVAVAEQSPLASSLEAALDQSLARLHPSASTPKARLIEAMVEVAGKQGMEHVTIPGLSAKAGVNRGIFYRHFSDRLDCLAEAHALVLGRIEDHLLEAAGKAPGATSDAALEALCAMLAREPATARIVLVEAGALAPPARKPGEASESPRRRLADVVEQTALAELPEPTPGARRIAAGGLVSLLRSELVSAGARSIESIAFELASAARSALVDPNDDRTNKGPGSAAPDTGRAKAT